MRTIKFRAWNLVRKEMWTDFFVDTDGNICYEVLHDEDDFKTMFWPPKDKNILMQSTGLFDKNGVEIWEGDVVRWMAGHYGDIEMKEVVKIEDGLLTPFYDMEAHDHDLWNYAKENYKYEVIGNVHEHPELLK